tara:strand:- start:29153 stop:30976 length:1824 start_codon:yes stop_codon:yes gene_type:complete
MCGIAGYFGKQKLSPRIISSTLNLMKSRGPDHSESFTHFNRERRVNLLHSRLSIIDLKQRSNQPFIIGNYVIIFNGEIYNFEALRKNLNLDSRKFSTKSDTEILLKYYIKYGSRCLEYFEGMWSFAIYNKENGELFLARDRFGEKPLFYFKDSNNFYFGSEIKYLKSLINKNLKINKNKIKSYLSFGYKSLCKNEKTFFKGVFSLNPGEFIKLNKRQFIKKKYWNLKPKIDHKISQQEAIEESGRLLQNSIKLRTRSDVPLTICLSGGVDASIIASYCIKKLNLNIKTFSIIDNDERYNEINNIKILLKDLKCKNKIININKKNFLEQLSDLVKYHDSPLASLAQYLHYLLMKNIRRDNYRVALSGTAADEIYSGYYEHFLLNFNEIKKTKKTYHSELIEWKNSILPNIRNPYFRNSNLYIKDKNFREHVYDRFFEFNKYLNSPLKWKFDEKKYSNNLYQNRKLNELLNETTPIILSNEDLNAMKCSIENRSPFLDRNLVEFMFSINPSYKIKKGISKFLLRKSSENFVNNEVLYDKKKKGFNCSIDSLIDFSDKLFLKKLIRDEYLNEFVNTKKLYNIINSKTKPNYLSKFLFNILNVQLFLKHNV